VVATVGVPAETLALGAALDATPGVVVRLDRVVPVGESRVPFLWVSADAAGAVVETLRRADGLRSVEVVDEAGDESLVRVEWSRTDEDVLSLVDRAGGAVLEAVGGRGGWTLRLRFPTRDALGTFYQACVDRGIETDLRSVHGPTPAGDGNGAALTDTQRETLAAAVARGYFEVPRRATLADLAADLGVSDSAVSQRLRRGTAAVLATALADEPTPRHED
jgi:predicted DNA binding protein